MNDLASFGGRRVVASALSIATLLVSGAVAAQPAEPVPPAEPPAAPGGPDVAPPDGSEPLTDAAPVPPTTVEETVAAPPPDVDAPPPRKAGVPVVVSYDRGTIFATEDDAFQLKLSLRTQLRLEVERPLEDGSEIGSHFVIPRARLQLEGHVFAKDTRYKVEFALGDRGSFGFVKDLFIDQKIAAPIWLRLGQWKRPFNRQELVSDFASAFNERAITAEFVGGGRDLGVSLHNDYEKSPDGLEWAVGVFNGFSGGSDRPRIVTSCEVAGAEIECATPAPQNFPADFSPALVARVGWNLGGIKGYSESDLEGGPLRLAVGASYKIDLADLEAGEQESTADNLSHGAQGDLMLKVEGFDLLAGVYLMKLKADDALLGGLVQAGYFLVPKKAHIAGRFALVQTDDDREEIEARAAVSWYWQGHAWKVVSDAGFLQALGEDAAGVSDDPDLQLRIMAQLTL